MKWVLAAATVLVFGALWLFDTKALFQLTAACVTGECGLHPAWFAGGLALLAAGALIFGRQRLPEPERKTAQTRTRAAPKTKRPRAKAATERRGSARPASRRRPRPVPDR